jgi:Asp-tRNA(Asn)/Glu-tRNA(Gln) amidotransferase A subunit family amidase
MTFDRIEDLHRALDSGQTTCAALAEEALRRAESENPGINALAELFGLHAGLPRRSLPERARRE